MIKFRAAGLYHSAGPQPRASPSPLGPIKYVVGSPQAPYNDATSALGSKAMGYVNLSSFTKANASCLRSLTLTASTTKLLFLCSWKSFSIAGISSRHGSHQVAQKLRNMVFPRKSLREIFFPSESVRVKSGVGAASFMGCRIGIALKLIFDWAHAGVVPSAKNIRNKPQKVRTMRRLYRTGQRDAIHSGCSKVRQNIVARR